MQFQMCSLEECVKRFPLTFHRHTNVTKYFLCSELGTDYCKGKNSQTVVIHRKGTGKAMSIMFCFLSVAEN